MRAWRLRHSRQIKAVLARKGVRNDRTFHRARGAMYEHIMCKHMAPCAFGTRSKQKPRKRLNARVPHANGLCGLLHVPGASLTLTWTPFGRAVARTCTWTVRPCCRRLSPPAPFKGSTDPQACLGSGIVAATRIPLRVTKTIATRPSIGTRRDEDIGPRRKVHDGDGRRRRKL